MQVATTNAQGGAATAASQSASSRSTLDYQSFLRLLVTQMQNQDPTSPMDSTQWVSQLASFSGVEQMIQANSKLDAILAGSGASEASALIGRTVSTADGATRGVVVSVDVSASSRIATLADGSTVDLTSGVTVQE